MSAASRRLAANGATAANGAISANGGTTPKVPAEQTVFIL